MAVFNFLDEYLIELRSNISKLSSVQQEQQWCKEILSIVEKLGKPPTSAELIKGLVPLLDPLSQLSSLIARCEPDVRNTLLAGVQLLDCPVSSLPSACCACSRARAVMYGLAIGDSLGSTSEFMIPWEVGKAFNYSERTWPALMISTRLWRLGEPTDDTDMVFSACVENSSFVKGHGFTEELWRFLSV